jgi:hypothetical protein
MRTQLLLLSILIGWGISAACAAAGPATKPTTMPTSPEVRRLIVQLGDADPALRQSAAARLKELGKAALSALREASLSPDPETSAAAAALVKRIERRVPDPMPQDARVRSSSMRISASNGQRIIDVDAEGRKIHIAQGPDGIVMTVTGVEDGRPATAEFKAKTPDELKKDEPEAYELYSRWAEGKTGIIIRSDVQIRQPPL